MRIVDRVQRLERLVCSMLASDEPRFARMLGEQAPVVPRRYKVVVGCVDGETTYSLESPSRDLIVAFLQKKDHEGSSLSLVTPSGKEWTTNETVYQALGVK